MSSIELIVDGVTVFEEDAPCESEEPCTAPNNIPKLDDDTIVLAQVRASVTGVYFQAKFANSSRQSTHLENVNVNGLEDTFDETTKSARLSLAGSGNHYYTPAVVVGDRHVYADNIHIGDLPEGWGDGRKS